MLLQNDLIAQGMKFKLNASTEEIIGDTDVTGIRLVMEQSY